MAGGEPRPGARGGPLTVRASLRLLLGWGLFAYVVWVVVGERDSLRAIGRLSILDALELAALTVANYLFLGFGHARSLSAWGVGLRSREWFGLAVLNGLFDRAVPARGGALVRLAYLRERHAFAIGSFAIHLAHLFFTSIFTLGLIGCGVLAASVGRADADLLRRFAAIYAVALAVGGAGLYAPARLVALAIRVSARAREWETALRSSAGPWERLLEPRRLGSLVASYLGIFATYTLRLGILFEVTGADVSLASCAIAAAVLLAVTALPLLPGSLGIRELAIAWVAGELGIPAVEGLAVAVIDRAVQLAVLAPLGLGAWLVLMRRARKPVQSN